MRKVFLENLPKTKDGKISSVELREPDIKKISKSSHSCDTESEWTWGCSDSHDSTKILTNPSVTQPACS